MIEKSIMKRPMMKWLAAALALSICAAVLLPAAPVRAEEMPPEENSGTFTLTLPYQALTEQGWITSLAVPGAFPETREALKAQTRSAIWGGPILTKLGGICYGPSGKESYYSLDMTPVLQQLARFGISGDFWIRDDGVKMYGQYIMCAANYTFHPYGTLVESSLGTCIVCDTGGFAQVDPFMLDIAVAW